LTVCPTHALPAEFVLDSNLCISYLTIEYKGIIERSLRGKIGNHIFGCDDCQDCCPWNRFASATDEKAYYAKLERKAPRLTELAFMSESEFKECFAESPILRSKHKGMMRNTAIALGNWGSEEALKPLEHLLHSEFPIVRLHAAWASGQIPGEQSRKLLKRVLSEDEDESVRQEAADMLD
jgi:epoxyqueuosine reductase